MWFRKHAVKKSPDNKNKNITILSHTSSLERNPKIEKAVEIFNKSNENITVNFQSHNAMDYYDSLIVKFMSNAKDFDIFCLDNDDSYYFIRNKVMLDLGIYSSVTDKFNNMFDGIKQNHVINNELIGVPLNINLQAWLVNEQLREILDIDCPVSTWTWDDFYDLACEAQKDLNGDGSPDTYALSYSRRFPPFVDQFISYNIDLINSKASFDKDPLIHLLNLWKSMASKNLVLEIGFSEKTSKQDNILFTTESISLMEGNKTIVRPPIIERQEVYPVSINNFCINKNSLNKELSAEFLATFLSHEVQAMYPESGNAYYEDISYYKAESNNNYFGTLSNDINYNLYKNMLSKSRRKVYQKDFNIYFGDILEDFMTNRLSAEKSVDLIAEKASIIIRE